MLSFLQNTNHLLKAEAKGNGSPRKCVNIVSPLILRRDRYVNSLYNFNEMSVRQVLRMKNILS